MEFWNFNVSVSMKGFAGILKIPERDRKITFSSRLPDGLFHSSGLPV